MKSHTITCAILGLTAVFTWLGLCVSPLFVLTPLFLFGAGCIYYLLHGLVEEAFSDDRVLYWR